MIPQELPDEEMKEGGLVAADDILVLKIDDEDTESGSTKTAIRRPDRRMVLIISLPSLQIIILEFEITRLAEYQRETMGP